MDNLDTLLPELALAAEEVSILPQPRASMPIIFCPVCCTNMDAPGWGLVEAECGTCGTVFAVVLTEATVAANSIV